MKMLYDYIGCSGWSYTIWQGPFYPSNIENSSWLNYYSHVFDYVEIDSSFYRILTGYLKPNGGRKKRKYNTPLRT
jgi:uncharacterized protein YecE (DUF72 family)